MEAPESKPKKERLLSLLREAAREFREDPKKGWARIGFLERRSGKVWYMEWSQVADVTETEIIFSDGATFPVEQVEEAELWKEEES